MAINDKSQDAVAQSAFEVLWRFQWQFTANSLLSLLMKELYKASIRWQHSAPPHASNGGRSLCVHIKERSNPLPIYWYHSKGNWLRYNFAADSFLYNETLKQILAIWQHLWQFLAIFSLRMRRNAHLWTSG